MVICVCIFTLQENWCSFFSAHIFYLNDGIKCIPRYTHVSFWYNTEMDRFLYMMFLACICALNAFWFIYYLFGQRVIAHLDIPSVSAFKYS